MWLVHAHTFDLSFNNVIWVAVINDKITHMCTHTDKQKHKLTHFPISISGIPQHLGKTLCCPKKLMHNRPLSLSLSPSPSPFGLVKPSQIKSAFHQGFVIVVFVRGTVVLRAFRACLSTKQDLCCRLVLVIRCCVLVASRLCQKSLLDLKVVYRSPGCS